VKRLLLFDKTWKRLQREFEALPPHEAILFHAGGEFTFQGRPIAPTDVRPDFTWINADVWLSEGKEKFGEVLLEASGLDWVQSAGAGADLWVVPGLLKKGVRVCTTHIQSVGIAEYVLACVLTYFQRERERRMHQQSKTWKQIGFREVADTNWLIIGFGAIGQDVAKRAKAFDAHIVGVRRDQTPDPLADRIVPVSQIPAELPNADVVVLAVPAETGLRHLVNADFLSHMKPGSVLVNVGRGGLVVDADLIAALDKGIPEHAILDTFEPEPLPPEHPYWSHTKVSVSPHSSAYGNGLSKRADVLFLENARRYLTGEPLIRVYQG
jgi:phosphoglycerate dehydrogenase-like enzyme